MSSRTHTVLVYSDALTTRDAIRMAVGRRPADDLGAVTFVEASSVLELLAAVDAGGIDTVVLDGEARPAGGFGLAKQLKDEVKDCPPTLLLTARPVDAWLASWALADGVGTLPIDVPTLRATVADLLRHRESALPVRRAAAV